MGIFKSLRRGRTGGSSSSATTAIIDTRDLVGRSGRNAGPRERVQLLKKLGDFAEKEAISLTAVVIAPPLREAADGDKYKGITVRYAEKGAFPTVIGKVARKLSGRTSTVVITGNGDTEQEAVSAGAAVMQTATLKKALGMEEERAGRSGGGGRRRKRGGGGGDRGSGSGGAGNRKPRKKEAPAKNDEASEEERIIRDLVDPL